VNREANVARETGNLKAKQVEKLLRAGKPSKHYDGLGLRLEIKHKKAANWVARYQIDGVERWMGLGSARTFTLAEARARNRILVRQRLADGIDPLQTRRAEQAAKLAAAAKAMTFSEACRRFLEQHGDKWSNPKHRKQWEATLATYAEPIIGPLPVGHIDVPLILKVLEQPVEAGLGYPAGPLWQTRPETASRLRNRLENILDWCKARQLRAGDNPAALSIIGKVLPGRTDAKHHAAMDFKAVPAFMQTLRSTEGVAPRALEFLVLTAARSQEVLKARWSEIDLDEGVWTVPPERMKMKREHRVPLAPEVVALLRGLYREGDGTDGFVFIGTQAGQPLGHTTMAMLLKRLGQNVTVHGFRSSFRDWAGERTAYAHDICEAALAHVKGKVERAYARGDLFDKRRRLMRDWARYCSTTPSAGSDKKIRPLRGADATNA
jgi:integrase